MSMKSYKILQLVPVLALLFATACTSPKPDPKPMNQVDDSHCAPFTDAKSANLVLEYYRPDTIYMKRPDAHEGPFLTIFTTNNIASEVKRRVPQHDCAAIVLGYIYTPEQEQTLFKNWEGIMRDCGFQRVVFLRAGRHPGKIDGLPVLHDSAIAGLNEPVKLVARNN